MNAFRHITIRPSICPAPSGPHGGILNGQRPGSACLAHVEKFLQEGTPAQGGQAAFIFRLDTNFSHPVEVLGG